VTDIFFSYSSKDRERVRPVRDALVAQGFEVFWDQQVPSGLDWDNWIRQHLKKCKCAMAFWSDASVSSDNVRHEATVAKQHGKLISVLLEPLTAEQFPMGLYAEQAANLSGWDGDLGHEEWRKFRREFEAKLTPGWVRQHIDELEAELVGERARREGVERRDKILQAQIAKEADTQLGLQRERDSALDEIAALKGTVAELTRARSEAEARETDTLQQVAALKVTVDEVTRARSDAEQRLSKLRQTKAKELVRSISPFVIAAALATVGIWTYQLIWPAPQPLPALISDSTVAGEQQEQLRQAAADTQAKLEAAEGERHRLKDEVQRQTKAAAEVEAKLQAAQAEQQRQTNAVAEAQTKLQGAQAAARDADTKRQAAEKAAADADT
jgi:predicted  nucleic acid-binding Zn-ribbon protein